MNCAACGTDNREGARFCHECGGALEQRCPRCGVAVVPEWKFCEACGTRVGGASAGPEPPPPNARAATAETPPHLAAKILAARLALADERKVVTVLFADLKGSTELVSTMDPEDAQGLLDPVVKLMVEAVHRYEGTVTGVMGDGIMALFGAPISHEDHALRACYAALRMPESVRRHAAEVARTKGWAVACRVGLNTGEVLVRSIGVDLHVDYTAQGLTTHLAARMEQTAQAGKIQLTTATLGLVEGFVQTVSLGPVAIKGLREPVTIFELVGAVSSGTRLQVAAARGLTRFVGRNDQLAVLGQALSRARDGAGQLVAVGGEPGVGKSRLFWEFSHSPSTAGWLVLEAGSPSYTRATAYLPLIGLLRAYFQIGDTDDAAKILDKVTGKLLSLDHPLDVVLDPIRSILDLPVDDRAWIELEAPQRRHRTLDALTRLVVRESQIQPLLLIFEDLHLVDSETQSWLDRLVGSLPTARILVLANYRPDFHHPWGGRPHVVELRVEALPPEGADRLLDDLLGMDLGLTPLKALLIERTEGNPFFIEESVRTLVETGALAGERGAYRVTRPLREIPAPASVQSLLAARIDRLTVEDKRLLQTASVIGKDVPFRLLRAIADMDEEALRAGLDRLIAGEFIYATSLFPELEYTFRQSLTHQVAYGSLTHDRRRIVHTRVVESIEALHARLDEHVDRLALHAFRGGLWDKALTYYRRAGLRDAGRSAHREAIANLEQAVAALGHRPADPEGLAVGVDLRIDLRNSLVPLAGWEAILGHLQEAERIAATLGDETRLARVQAAMGNYYWSMGDLARAVELGGRALVTARTSGDLACQVTTGLLLGQAQYFRGAYRDALDSLGFTVELIGTAHLHERFGVAAPPSIFARDLMGRCLAELGRLDEAAERADEALRIAEEVGQPYGLTLACLGVGFVSVRRGDPARALAPLERCQVLCDTAGIVMVHGAMAPYLGHTWARLGRLEEAAALLEREMGQPSSRANRAAQITSLAEVRLAEGRIDEAARVVARALHEARESGVR
ncbi:MAG TPA: adenylate/guanylate cyclase domain-containing protein, partial [Candidatus Limnocylindrales bacterium]|nr:adenylate/guanylate cyclase domain-containing protein [Candidatus Limnocylindrales bacterium]